MDQMYRCSQCGETKPVTEFAKNRNIARGHTYLCKACKRADMKARREADPEGMKARQRAWYAKHRQAELDKRRKWRLENPTILSDQHLKHRLGLPAGTYDTMHNAHDGKCAICGAVDGGRNPRRWRNKRLHVDHNADTGAIRGLLCHNCNTGIGHLQHDLTIFRAAIAYLEKHAAG